VAAAGATSGVSAAFGETSGADLRPQYDLIRNWLADTPAELVALKRREAELLFRCIGTAFASIPPAGRNTRRPRCRRGTAA
jgi:hypothetical protein